MRFGGCIASHVDAPLPEGVLARTIARNRNSEAADTQTELLRLLGGDGAGTGVLVGGAAGRTVRYEMVTASVALMPMDRDRVLVAAGAQALGDDPSTDETESDFRLSAAHVAVGCASDVNTTTARARVDQNNNGGSDLRISQTGTIKARNQRTGPTRAPAVRTALLPNGEGRQPRSPGVRPGAPSCAGTADNTRRDRCSDEHCATGNDSVYEKSGSLVPTGRPRALEPAISAVRIAVADGRPTPLVVAMLRS